MKKKTRKLASKLPTIIGIIICVVVLPVMVMNVTMIVKSYVHPDKVPDFFGVKPLIVTTGSMETSIHGGDLVVAKTVDPAELKEGDIVSYKSGESVVTHRIVTLTEKDGQPAFTTKGDANNIEDSKAVTYDQIEGIYWFRVPGVGHLAMAMQTPGGMLLFIGVPVCGFLIFDLVRRKRRDRHEIEELKAKLENQNNNRW